MIYLGTLLWSEIIQTNFCIVIVLSNVGLVSAFVLLHEVTGLLMRGHLRI